MAKTFTHSQTHANYEKNNPYVCATTYKRTHMFIRILYILYTQSQTQFNEREREKIVAKGKCGQKKRRVKKETTMEKKKGKRPEQRGINKKTKETDIRQ